MIQIAVIGTKDKEIEMNLDKETLIHIRGLIDELINKDDSLSQQPNQTIIFPWDWNTRYIDNYSSQAIIHLSGMGEWNNMDKALTMGPNENSTGFNMYYILPNTSTGMYNPDRLNEIVQNLKDKYNKVYLTGISSGCTSIYNYLKRYQDVDGCICVAGKSGVFENNTVPVWHFHNEDDLIVPLQAGTINAFNNGCIEKITIYEKSGHDAWTETFENQEIYEYLKSY